MRDDKPSVLCEQEGVDPIPQAGQDNPAASNLYKGSDNFSANHTVCSNNKALNERPRP